MLMAEAEAQTAREKLAEEIGAVPWNTLQIHANGGTLVLVSSRLDLVDVGVALAEDQTGKVRTWLDEGLIYKPEKEEIQELSKEDGTPFSFLIVQPFVVAQAVLS